MQQVATRQLGESMKLKEGDRIDDWALIAKLGAGGNGQVWRASRSGGEFALKVLHDAQGERRQRFADEVAIMRAHQDHAGVLPLVDARLAEERSSNAPQWIATPIAETVRRGLGPAPPLSLVVAAVLEYATTLADLAGGGVGHRDLKPQNLFRLDDRWVIGDWGLATYPEKPAITPRNRRLGSVGFMAPEMMRNPDEACSEPADVYSLANSALVGGVTRVWVVGVAGGR
jgi:serine/threonine protein kinase